MQDKNYIGRAKLKESTEGKKSYGIALVKEKIQSLNTDENDNLIIHLASRKDVKENGITHSVYEKPELEDKYYEASLMLRKTDLLKIQANEKGNIFLDAFSRKADDIKKGDPQLSVKEFSKNQSKETNLVGVGYNRTMAPIKEYLGNVRAIDYANGRSFIINFLKDEMLKAEACEKGYIKLTIADRKEEGKYNETHVMYLRKVQRDPNAEVNISLNKEKIKNLKPNESGYVNIIASTLSAEFIKDKYPDVSVKEAKRKTNTPSKDNYVGNGFLNYENHHKNKEKLLSSQLTQAIQENNGNRVKEIINIDPELLKSDHIDLIKKLIRSNPNLDNEIVKVMESKASQAVSRSM